MATTNGNGRFHTVAIGASAGGIEALRHLVAALPPNFPAVVLVVLHLAPRGTSVLPQILGRAGPLPAVHAEDGAKLEGGTIYVAPPNAHMFVVNDVLHLDHGPRENGHRPAVDRLFRSVANTYGAEAAGVVLSGVLDDGTAGLMEIKMAGGMTLAQDPEEALYNMMPRTAIEIVTPDHIGTAEQLGKILGELAHAAPLPQPEPRLSLPQEHLIEVDRGSSDQPQPGVLSGLTCPDCNGAIWLHESNGVAHFACRTGHAYSSESFVVAQTERVEAALYTALRTLEERAALYRRMAARHRDNGNARSADRFALRAESAVQHGFILREVIDQFSGETASESVG